MNRAEFILEHVHGPRILDVGCADHSVRSNSPYWVHGHLRRKFSDVWGIDVEPEFIEQLKSRGYQHIHLASAETFSLETKFDSIVAGELIEHLCNPGGFLEQARKHLKQDGRLILTTPNPFGLLNVLYAWTKHPKTCANYQHTAWLCPTTLRQMAERVGFKVEKLELIEDYEDETPSIRYRLFVRVMRLAGRLLPRIVRCNDMLCVLRRADAGVSRPSRSDGPEKPVTSAHPGVESPHDADPVRSARRDKSTEFAEA